MKGHLTVWLDFFFFSLFLEDGEKEAKEKRGIEESGRKEGKNVFKMKC